MTSKPLYDDSPPPTGANDWPIYAARIVALTFLIASVYGIFHERISVAISPEFFTVGRPQLIKSRSPTQLAIVWGIYDMAVFGILGGLLLAVVARVGRRPKLTASDLFRPLLILMVVVGVLSFLGGALGWQLAVGGQYTMHSYFAARVPPERHTPYLAVGAAKWACYLGTLLGGIVLFALVARKRGRMGPPAPARMNRAQVRAARGV